jgi:hypothetical protein
LTRSSAVGAALLAAAAGLGAAALGAALLGVPSPVVAVGNHAIDLAPGPLKDYAVRQFGENDKPILVASVLVVLTLLAVVAGLVALRRPTVALAMTSLIGAVAIIAGYTDGSTAASPLVAALPGVLALGVSVGTFAWLLSALAKRARRNTPSPLQPHPGDDLPATSTGAGSSSPPWPPAPSPEWVASGPRCSPATRPPRRAPTSSCRSRRCPHHACQLESSRPWPVSPPT